MLEMEIIICFFLQKKNIKSNCGYRIISNAQCFFEKISSLVWFNFSSLWLYNIVSIMICHIYIVHMYTGYTVARLDNF